MKIMSFLAPIAGVDVDPFLAATKLAASRVVPPDADVWVSRTQSPQLAEVAVVLPSDGGSLSASAVMAISTPPDVIAETVSWLVRSVAWRAHRAAVTTTTPSSWAVSAVSRPGRSAAHAAGA